MRRQNQCSGRPQVSTYRFLAQAICIHHSAFRRMEHVPRYGSWVLGECGSCRYNNRPIYACQMCRQPTCRNCVYLLMSFQRNEIWFSRSGRQHVQTCWMDWCVCWHCFNWASYLPEEWVYFQERLDHYIDEWENGVFHHIRQTTQRLYEELEQDLRNRSIHPSEVPAYFAHIHAELERRRVAFGYPNLTDDWNWQE